MKYVTCKETDYFDTLYEKVLEMKEIIQLDDSVSKNQRMFAITLELGNPLIPKTSGKYKERE